MADNTISLEFISRQLTQMRQEAQEFRQEVRSEFQQLEVRMAMNAGMWTRLDAQDQGLTASVRGMEQMVMNMDQRLRRLEDAQG